MSSARPDAIAEWTPTHPTDVVLTVGRLQSGRGDPIQRLALDRVLWRTVRTPEGAATIRVDGVEGRLRVAAWGPGADAAVAMAPDLLGARDDPTGFQPRHPILINAHRRFSGLRIARTGDVFQALVAAALEQRVVGLDALASWSSLLRRLGEPAPGPTPGMVIFPPPRVWAAIPSWEWHRAGVDAKRAAVIQAAARMGESLQRLTQRNNDEVDAALQSIPGVGAWTSAEVRQRALGDADAVSVGDYHLAAMVGEVLEHRPFTDAELIAYLEPWRGHRYRVARLLYALGYESAQRRGPRASRVDNRGR